MAPVSRTVKTTTTATGQAFGQIQDAAQRFQTLKNRMEQALWILVQTMEHLKPQIPALDWKKYSQHYNQDHRARKKPDKPAMDIDPQERFKVISAGVLVRLKAYNDCEEQAHKLHKWFSTALDFADKFGLDQIEPPSEWSRKIFKKIEKLLQESHWRVGYHVILKMRLKDGKAALKQAFVDGRPALLVHFAKLKREVEDAAIIARKPNGNKSKRTATAKLPSRVTKKPKTTHTDQPVSTAKPKTANNGPRTKKQKVAPSEA